MKKVAMGGVDKEKKQVAMKVANTNCLDDLIDNALLLLFLLLDCRICIKRRCNSQTCCACVHVTPVSPVTSLTPSPTLPPSPLPLPLEGRGQKNFHPKNFQKKKFKKKFSKKISKKKFQKKIFKKKNSKKNFQKKFQKKIFQKKKLKKKFPQKKNVHPTNFHPKKFSHKNFFAQTHCHSHPHNYHCHHCFIIRTRLTYNCAHLRSTKESLTT